jgi:Zn-dependent protease with chaperone function
MGVVAVQGAVAAAMVEALLRLWRVEDPGQALQLRRLVLALPVLVSGLTWTAAALGLAPGFPVLFEVRPWLSLPLPGGGRAWAVGAAVAAGSASLFALQELLPALARRPPGMRRGRPYRAGELPALDAALVEVRAAYGAWVPSVRVTEEGDPMACLAGAWRMRLLVSRRLVAMLTPRELSAVLAHEAAHALRGDLRAGWAWFVLRALQAFSPAALLIFRWILADQERACDRLAVSRTGDAPALASALEKVEAATAPPLPRGAIRRFLRRAGTAWEVRLAERRLRDLRRGDLAAPVLWWPWRLAAATLGLGGVLALVS